MAKLYQQVVGMDKLEALARMNSPVHRLHPMAKLVTTFVYLFTVLSFPRGDVSALSSYILYPAVVVALSGIPLKIIFKRLLLALPFSLMGGISNLFLLRDANVYIGGFAVTEGMFSFASIMLKTLLCVSAALILVATTPFNDLIKQMNLLRIPKIICLQFLMTYRYIAAVIDEAAAMHTAYMLRAGGMRGISMKNMGTFLGRLTLRGFDRAEIVYHAMKCRGLDVFLGSITESQSDGADGREASTCKNNANPCFSIKDFLYTIVLTKCFLLFRLVNISLILEAILHM